ncbi:MAG: hypothetical protein M0Z49_06740 [Chloroflexi bacterium]|nr:hypothetical protein [Chloroflexota bacterium]
MTSARATAVWIDSSSATIVRWGGDESGPVRLESDVPSHHRSTGHLAAPGGERHGGTGPRSAGERHRLEHLRAFLALVRAALPGDDLLLMGDGIVVQRLAASVRGDDAAHGVQRRIELRRCGPLTVAQQRAALREFVGEPPRRVHAASAVEG